MLQLAQKDTYEELSKYLTQNTPENVPHNLKKLCPFVDEEGTIQVKGRLRLSGLSTQAKHTVSLSSKHLLVIMMMRQAHEDNYHEITEYVRSILQEEF